MQYENVFELIAKEFAKRDLRHILIGGFAVNAYGVTRQTADFDLIIDKTQTTIASECLEQNGYKQDSVHRDVFARFTCDASHLYDVDLMFVDSETIDKFVSKAREITIAEHSFLVPSIEHLIALKLHSIKYNQKLREFKDLPDIINLITTNKVDTTDSDFRELCLKYGSQELLDKITAQVTE